MVALALVLQLVEGMLPMPYIAPGVKLGLANIVSLIAIIYFGFKSAFIVVIFRASLAAFLSGRPYLLLLGGVGALLSIIIMGLMYKHLDKYFSLRGISMMGAITHNFGQILMASVLMETIRIFSYLPVLLITGLITGYFIGLVAELLKKSLDPILQT